MIGSGANDESFDFVRDTAEDTNPNGEQKRIYLQWKSGSVSRSDMRFRGMIFAIGGGVALLAAAYLAATMYVDAVEQPNYRTLASDGSFEVRDYGSMIVAEVAVRGSRKDAVNRAFSPLANYIFAKERSGDAISMTAPVTQSRREPIAMTAPVTQSRDKTDGEWTVRFVMPAEYTLDSLPTPQNRNITLSEVKGVQRAVVRFSGVASDALIAEKESKLQSWIESRGLKAAGAPTYAYYNAPFTPGFMRRNEIMFDLQSE